MSSQYTSELDSVEELLNKDKETNTRLKNLGIDNEMSLEQYFVSCIRSNLCSTIGIKYEPKGVYVSTQMLDGNNIKLFDKTNIDAYEDFCTRVLKIDMNEKYNCSRSIRIDGIRTRVFAMMPPFTSSPLITISTTKQPPTTYDTKQTISDDLLNEIVHSNFMIVGGSGSGKTYFTNYILNKFIHKDERIAFIEEFGELIPPNDLTNCILVPPPKPGEESLLRFATEQSNLMRLDAFYVGEIKGAEAWPTVLNLASGTRGGFTMHGETVQAALNRLRALCNLASGANPDAIDDFIAKSLKYVVVMYHKNIKEIYKLMGTSIRGNFALEEVAS